MGKYTRRFLIATLHNIVRTHLFILHINQQAYFMERNIEYIYISRTTQRTNTGQIPACSQEPADFTNINIVETLTCLKTTQQENFTVQY